MYYGRNLAVLVPLILALGACASGADEAQDPVLDSGSEGEDPSDDDGDSAPNSSDDGDADDGDADDGSNDDGPQPSDHHDDINAYIASLGTPDSPAPETVEGEPGAPEPSGDYTCTRTNLQETEQFAEIVAFAANSGSMYPGAIVGGKTIETGLFTPRVLPRAPLTFSASLEGVVDGPVSAQLPEPSLSSFREAMAEILSQKIVGNTPADIHSQIEEVYSHEQLGLAVGLDVGWLNGDIAASMRFDDSETRSRFVVQFTQTYYTVDIDPPGTAADFFAPSVTKDDVEAEIEDDPPAYVSSVSYGRTVYFAATSELSSQELRAALDFGFKGTVSVDGSVSLTHEEVLENSEITAFVLGGDSTVAVQAIFGVDQLRDFIQSGGTYSPESPGAAIAYKLAYLHDDSPARFSLTTDYEVEECTRVTQNVRVGLNNLTVVNDGGDGGEELELYGTIWVVDENDDAYVLWSAASNQYVTVGTGMSWPQDGEIDSIIVPVTPQPGGNITLILELFDDDGAFNGDDAFGVQFIDRPFEDGWRAEIAVPAANGDQHIEVDFELMPVD
jgi:thiol-activated cytolysin